MGGVSHARLRRLGAGAAAGVLVGVFVAVLAYVRPSFLDPSEHSTYDFRARAVASHAPSKDILFIDVAEEDISNAERNWGVTWPWPRAVWGYIAQYIARGGARAVVYDWVFHDRGLYSVEDAEEFADAVREVGNVVIGLALHSQPDREESGGGPWGMKLAELPRREEAEQRALRLMAWDVRSYIQGDGPATLYIGGFASADAARASWDRISAVAELASDLGLATDEGDEDGEGDEGEDGEPPTTSGPPEPPAPPEPIELSADTLASQFSVRSFIARRDGFEPAHLKALFPVLDGMYVPLAVIGVAPKRMGTVTQERDHDGVMRRHAPFHSHGGRLYPSLAMAALLVGNPDIVPTATRRSLTVGSRTIPLDRNGHFIIRFNHIGRYEHIPAYEVLRSIAMVDEEKKPSVDPAIFKDKYVIISATGVSLRDSHSSPVAKTHPGAEIQANALENLLSGVVVSRVDPLTDAFAALACSVVSALLVMFVWGAIRRVQLALIGTFAVAVGLGLAWWQTSAWLLGAYSIWIAALAPLLSIGASAFAAVLTASAGERRSKRFVQEALGRYTSPALVAELTEHPEHLSLEWGEVRQMSVYFSDIAGFTSISEGLEPRKLVALLNEYLTSMTDIILAHDGVVDKYIGDAIMAFWGAPIPDKDHAAKAVRCALAMRKKCDELRGGWQERYGEDVFARAGVNSGEAVVGNMGSAHKYNYTVMGDMVNLAARLEGANKPYGSALMISEYTLEMLGDMMAVRELDLLAVKGKEQPVRVYEVLDIAGEVDEKTGQTVAAFAAGLAKYRERDFAAALTEFERALELDPGDGPSSLYAERCRHFLSKPPADDWDGVWRMTTK